MSSDENSSTREDEDVQGHLAKAGRAAPSDDGDDVQGHAARGKALVPDDDDVEGHASRGRV